jgi:serine/threonine protein kinase
MPLQDSFSRRPTDQSSPTHLPKPNRLPKPPSREDLDFTFSCALSNLQVPLGLTWKKEGKVYLLTVMCSSEADKDDSAWVLYTGNDTERSVMWSYRTGDIALIFSLLQDIDSAASGGTVAEGAGAQAQVNTGDYPTWATESQAVEPSVVPGSVFAENYSIISEIGSGGMGKVYKAQDKLFDRLVAIKVLHPHLVSDTVTKKRFEQEAKAAMTLAHPNLISVFHYGFSAQGLPFLVMEYIDGSGLDELIKNKRQLELSTFLDIFIQSCHALNHAHEKGIIHRDLKPSNVMVLNDTGSKKIVKIVDFGIAKLLIRGDNVDDQNLTLTGDIVGSPLYMSPEQCKGETLDVRSDIYSIGCLMYHAIVGVVPFEGENPLQTLGKHICDRQEAFGLVRPDLVIPTKLEDMIAKAMAKDAQQRYQSIKQLATELERLNAEVNPESVEAPAQTVPSYNSASQLLVDVGDLPATTLEAALKVQKMLRAGSLTLTQAANALGRAHLVGGQIAVAEAPGDLRPAEKGIETPVEAILVEAGLITNAVWRTVLSLQQKVRTGQLTKEQAMEEFRLAHPARAKNVPKAEEASAVAAAAESAKAQYAAVPKDVLELIMHAGLISTSEVQEAAKIAHEEGTELAKRLVAMGKIDNKILLSARQCLSLIEGDRLPVHKAVIALGYCQRSRVSFYEAIEELGWERP